MSVLSKIFDWLEVAIVKLRKLTATGFKGIDHVSIDIADHVTIISGQNEAGKTSILDAIQATLGGKWYCPKQPIRNGEERAETILETDTLVVTRRWTRKSDKLEVRPREGGPAYDSPQELLNELFTAISFDPLAFSRMKPADQAKSLRTIAGIDTDAMDIEYKETYARRTIVNGEAKQLESQLLGLKVPDLPQGVVELIDMDAITDKLVEAQKLREANSKVRRDLRDAEIAARAISDEVERLKYVLELEQEKLAKAKDLLEDLKISVSELVEVDVSALEAERAAAKKANEAARLSQAAIASHRDTIVKSELLAEQANKKRSEWEELTGRLTRIKDSKKEMLAAARFPLSGMRVEGDDVYINDVLFGEHATSRQIIFGLEIGAAMNPKLRAVLIRDASLFDDNAMRLVTEWAVEKEYQVVMERVDDSGLYGIYLENGLVRERPDVDGVVV